MIVSVMERYEIDIRHTDMTALRSRKRTSETGIGR